MRVSHRLGVAEIEFETINAALTDTDNHNIKCFGFFTQHGNCLRRRFHFLVYLFDDI